MTMASTPVSEPVEADPNIEQASVVNTLPIQDDSPTESDWKSVLQEHLVSAQDLAHRAAVPAAIALVAITLVSPSTVAYWIFRPLYYAVLQTIGIAVGIGLGLGLATHVYDQLEHWKDGQDADNYNDNNRSRQPPPPSTLSKTPSRSAAPRSTYKQQSTTSFLQDEQTYESLMAAAGYTLDATKLQRAQVARSSSAFFTTTNYTFTAAPCVSQTTAFFKMQEFWPTLPVAINEQLGQWIEHIIRDYVSGWYSSADNSCVKPAVAAAAAATAAAAVTNDANATTKDGGGDNDNKKQDDNDDNDKQQQQQQQQNAAARRMMIYSVAGHRPIPFLDSLYESMAVMFGNLATRVEHINVFEVVLLKWTRVLAHTFKVYRALRKSVALKTLAHQQHDGTYNNNNNSQGNARSFRGKKRRQQQQQQQQQAQQQSDATTNDMDASNPGSSGRLKLGAVSEMQMTKEFLFAGRLHTAVTFGMDVTSLLFADAAGRECGTGTDTAAETDDAVLEERLFGTSLLRECELDYNRVVGHRMVRALLTRADFGSPIVATLLTEIMGGSVLTSLMSCFCPLYLNGWIIKGLSPKPKEEAESEQEAQEALDTVDDEGLMRGWSRGEGAGASPSGNVNEASEPTRGLESEPTRGLESVEMTVSKANLFADDKEEETNGSSPEPAKSEQVDTSVDVDEETTPASPSVGSPSATSMGTPSATSLASLTVERKTDTNLSVAFELPDVPAGGNDVIAQLAMALIALQQHIDFEESRHARANNEEVTVNWDDEGCRSAVLRLVLVIEAALTEGRCTYKRKAVEGGESDLDASDGDGIDDLDDSERPVEVTLPDYESATLSQILMEMTSDIEAFEERVATDNVLAAHQDSKAEEEQIAEDYQPTSTEQSTLRTLIAAWLHTGQIYRTVTVLVQAHATILSPYYNQKAFLRSQANAGAFVRQLKALDGVDILVDTMTVLMSPRLDETNNAEIEALSRRASNRPGMATTTVQDVAPPAPTSFSAQFMTGSSSSPRHLDFHRNEAFASSLRSERERRLQSWESLARDNSEGLPIICRTTAATETDIAWHKELHHIARIFYTGTNLVGIRDAARRKTSQDLEDGSAAGTVESLAVQTSLLTVETACPRRRIEVPDDDSSFLLRAQPRVLNAVGVHRDQQNHDLSFRSFAATYEEPALATGSDHYNGGRFLRRCLIRYYPSDRTASVALQGDKRRVDQRKTRGTVPDTITVDKSSRPTPFLSGEFLQTRHLAQKWEPKGTTRTQSMLASSVMEQTDFTSVPRPGKAIDYVYRMSFFERPMADLGGKHFTVHDSSSLGTHRADASAMELSDASLSASILMMNNNDATGDNESAEASRTNTETGEDGYPIVWMKFSRKQDDVHVEMKPYRVSFIRAALLLTTARQEAQLQCLIKCVRAGSAKSATKALTDSTLMPTLRLVEYAGSRSREKQSLLLRDLKFGINHIDREQLRRNALLNPRYPTVITELSATVEDAVQAGDIRGVNLMGATGTLFKIRCVATLEYKGDEEDGSACYRVAEDGSIAEVFREEWVVYRSFKDFQALHKHLKSQVSAKESSGTAGSRLVGAATAAFAAGSNMPGRQRQRQVLIPSLSAATKAVTLAATRKAILKRKEYLHAYLDYILSPGHLLCRCTEILLYLGAFYPLPPDVSSVDPLGRTEMSCAVVRKRVESQSIDGLLGTVEEDGLENVLPPNPTARTTSLGSLRSADGKDEDGMDDPEERDPSQKLRKIDMIPAIRNKIDKVPLSQVRNRVFELLRYQFGFENASFIRNRMLAALKTASFAVTSSGEFQRTLYKLHTEHINANALAGWIEFALELIWPGGVFFESAPPPTPEELEANANKAKEVLHASFPEQVRAILGPELTGDGLDIFHEMLQNRLVVKSMAYMLFDLVWLEVFPEIGDVLVCGAALDIDP